jgi:hypothetical protein
MGAVMVSLLHRAFAKSRAGQTPVIDGTAAIAQKERPSRLIAVAKKPL